MNYTLGSGAGNVSIDKPKSPVKKVRATMNVTDCIYTGTDGNTRRFIDFFCTPLCHFFAASPIQEDLLAEVADHRQQVHVVAFSEHHSTAMLPESRTILAGLMVPIEFFTDLVVSAHGIALGGPIYCPPSSFARQSKMNQSDYSVVTDVCRGR